MKTKILATLVVLSLLGAAILGLRHIKNLDNQIQLKQIDLKDNSARLKLLDTKYIELNKELEAKDVDKAKVEQQLKDLQIERDKLQADLQAKKEQKAKDLAVKAQQAAQATYTPQKAYAASGNCAELSAHLQRLGVNGAELTAGITLATRESSCRSSAINASSGACGEFQSWPCGKWGTPGTDQYLLNAIAYSKNRYGGFVNALSHSYANNWY